jgi:hypothetical protein
MDWPGVLDRDVAFIASESWYSGGALTVKTPSLDKVE